MTVQNFTAKALCTRFWCRWGKKFNQHGIMRHFNSNFMHINISKNWITSASERWSEGHLAMARHAVSQHCALICQSSTKIYAFLWIENWHVVVQFNLFFCIWGWKSIEMRGERKMKFQFLKRNFRFLFFFISFFALTISISLYFLCVFFFGYEGVMKKYFN